MKIAVLSGKGGTGKTLVSVNLSAVAKNALYIDCDVEEPNGHLFFKPKVLNEESVEVMIPVVNEELCNGCHNCCDFCKFNALAYVGGKLMLFDEVCHSCGGCVMVCPQSALSEGYKEIGKITEGVSQDVKTLTGMLKTGEASGVPIIKKLLTKAKKAEESLIIIDCPPGSACTAMESISDADYCVLVAEPTIFGSHNLNMVYELVNIYGKPFSVVLNKCTEGENPSEEFCKKHNIKILGKIDYDNELGNITSQGKIAVRENEKYKNMFNEILQAIYREVK